MTAGTETRARPRRGLVIAGLLALVAASVTVAAIFFFFPGALAWSQAWVARHLDHLLRANGMVLAIFAGLLILEVLTLKWERTTLYRLAVRRSVSARVDLVIFGIVLLGLLPAVQVLLTFGIALAGSHLVNSVSAHLAWLRVPLPGNNAFEIIAGVLVYWTVASFYLYWVHRLTHLPLFWNLHRFHHGATELNMVTTLRFHPGEAVKDLTLLLSPQLFFAPSNEVLLGVSVLVIASGFWQHTELPWSLGWFGRWIVASPVVHQLHHSRDPRHHHCNYAVMPLWDHLFGTWYAGDDRPVAYGIEGDPWEDRPLTQLWQGLWLFYRDLAVLVARPFGTTRRREVASE